MTQKQKNSHVNILGWDTKIDFVLNVKFYYVWNKFS